jgi:hypothetical protein
MTNIVTFPGARAQVPPPLSAVHSLLDELTAVEIKLTRARIAQLNSETRQANTFFAWHCFKKVVFWACALWLFSHFVGGAKAEPSSSRSFYGSNGSFAGSSVTRDRTTNFYNARGSLDGTSIRYGRSTSFYDGRGRFTGSSINTGPRR